MVCWNLSMVVGGMSHLHFLAGVHFIRAHRSIWALPSGDLFSRSDYLGDDYNCSYLPSQNTEYKYSGRNDTNTGRRWHKLHTVAFWTLFRVSRDMFTDLTTRRLQYELSVCSNLSHPVETSQVELAKWDFSTGGHRLGGVGWVWRWGWGWGLARAPLSFYFSLAELMLASVVRRLTGVLVHAVRSLWLSWRTGAAGWNLWVLGLQVCWLTDGVPGWWSPLWWQALFRHSICCCILSMYCATVCQYYKCPEKTYLAYIPVQNVKTNYFKLKLKTPREM